jgi:hypothetical protein
MQTFTCSTCGKAWSENYCPECAHTIDRIPTPQLPHHAPAVTPQISQTLRALNIVSRPVPPSTPAFLPARPPRPAVVVLYRIWCGLILIVYVAFAIQESLILARKVPPELGPIAGLISRDDPTLHSQLLEEERENSIVGLALAIIGVALFGMGCFFCPRASWAWIWGIVAIVISVVPLCISIAGAIPLLIFWLKPETKQYFGRK